MSCKKTILFAIHYLELGGAEMSLIGLLGALDYTKYDVDLFVYSHRGELMELIPSQVHLLPEVLEYAQIERPMVTVLKEGNVRMVLARLKAKWQHGKYRRRNHPKDGNAIFSYVAQNVVRLLPPILPEKEYDLAVSFLMPHDYVLQKVQAKKKIAWIHSDYSYIDVDVALETKVWNSYDRIVSISPDVTSTFLMTFPSLKERIVEIPNILPVAWLEAQADAPLGLSVAPGVINLLSIGRFSHQKNFDNVPDICRRIREKGVDVRWYLIGYGGDEALIKQRITENGMEDHVILLGKKANPYPYIKACDIYVQPSRYEGCPVTIREAILLEKPIVVTSFPTVKSVIRDGVDGIIVPMDNEGCAEGIDRFIRNGGLSFHPDMSRIAAENNSALARFDELVQSFW